MANLKRGDFNKRVSFKNYEVDADGASGKDEDTGTIFLTTWAHVKDAGGNRAMSEGQDRIIDRKDIYVYVRASLMSNLKTETYIIYNNKEYSIDHHHLVDEIKKIIKFEAVG